MIMVYWVSRDFYSFLFHIFFNVTLPSLKEYASSCEMKKVYTYHLGNASIKKAYAFHIMHFF